MLILFIDVKIERVKNNFYSNGWCMCGSENLVFIIVSIILNY